MTPNSQTLSGACNTRLGTTEGLESVHDSHVQHAAADKPDTRGQNEAGLSSQVVPVRLHQSQVGAGGDGAAVRRRESHTAPDMPALQEADTYRSEQARSEQTVRKKEQYSAACGRKLK